MQETCISNTPVVTEICDRNKPQVWHHRSLKIGACQHIKNVSLIVEIVTPLSWFHKIWDVFRFDLIAQKLGLLTSFVLLPCAT